MSQDRNARRPHERHWLWDEALPVIRREILIAATVAGSLTLVLLARRWVSAFLGQGALNEEIFAGNAVVTELVGEVERRVRSREEDHERHQRSAARRARTHKRGTTNGSSGNNGNDA